MEIDAPEQQTVRLQPYHAPVPHFTQKWAHFRQSRTTTIPTLNNKPGNNARPPPNNYKVYSWTKEISRVCEIKDELDYSGLVLVPDLIKIPEVVKEMDLTGLTEN